MTTNMLVFPSAKAPTTVQIRDRSYTCAVGATPIAVPDFDAQILLNNGWLASARNGTGTTAQRPAANPATNTPAPGVGYEYYDTTISAKVIWNGSSWINYATGVAA